MFSAEPGIATTEGNSCVFHGYPRNGIITKDLKNIFRLMQLRKEQTKPISTSQ